MAKLKKRFAMIPGLSIWECDVDYKQKYGVSIQHQGWF